MTKYLAKLVFATVLCLVAARAEAAGIRFIEVPADSEGPALTGAVWSPCATPPREVEVAGIALPGVKDCPILGDKLPLVVISHGRTGSLIGHHDTAETLADAGFIVAAINHPGDTSTDTSRSDDLSAFVERPTDIKRLIDYMLQASPVATKIDPQRIGFFGFSRGGYTGLVLIGANPDWATVAEFCGQSTSHACEQVRRKEFPTQPLTHDARIKAAVIADPLTIMFSRESYAAITVPVELWQSGRSPCLHVEAGVWKAGVIEAGERVHAANRSPAGQSGLSGCTARRWQWHLSDSRARPSYINDAGPSSCCGHEKLGRGSMTIDPVATSPDSERCKASL